MESTCVTHDYPFIGKDIGAIPILKQLVDNQNKLILLTMRSGKLLDNAVAWFEENGITLWGIQDNPDQKSWTDSRKVYAQVYIDDAALGCPLSFDESLSDRSFVNWKEVESLLEEKGALIKQEQ